MARNKINEHLKKNYYYMWREWPYKHIQPKILIEEYMIYSGTYTAIKADVPEFFL